ncbi:MAG: DUF4097 family beta strand repeat-containing protein [Pseudonocardia sp.]
MSEPGMGDELVRQQAWTVDGPGELELAIDVGRVRVELTEGAAEVRVEVRHDPAAGSGWTQGISGLISWLGTAGPFDIGHRDPATLAADAVAAAEISWSDAARRLVVRNSQELPLRVVPLAVTVWAPAGTRLSVRTGAGDVTVTGSAGESDVRTGSGDVTLGAVGGSARVRTGSGGVTVGAATGTADIKAGSGDVRIGEIDGDLRVRSGSGDVAVTDARAGSLELATGSGELRIAVHAGVAAELDLSSGSGRARSELDVARTAPEHAPVLRVRGRTGSGDVLVTRATVPA